MFSHFKYIYCVMFLVLQNSVHKSIELGTNEKVTRILKILHQKSWRLFDYPEKSIADQRILVDEFFGQFIDITKIPLKINGDNIDIITSRMYVALGCKCGETIVDTFNLFIKWLDDEHSVYASIISTLIEFNKTILKTISIMFDFIHISPNVLSFEPGFLKIAVLINFHLNYLIEKCQVEENCPLNKIDFTRIIFQMINLLERFTISYCSSTSNKPNPMDYTYCRVSDIESPQLQLKTLHVINYFENLLNNTGLSISNFYKYNISNNTSKDFSLDEDNLKFNIIVYVLNNINSLLENQQIFLKSPEMDIEKVFVDQKSMFDLIMLVFHNYTEAYLVELERYQNKESESTFLIKTNIRDNQLIEKYEELQIESNLKKFPTDFINQIKLILRVLKTIYYAQNILDIDILIKHERNQIALLSDRLRKNIELDDNLTVDLIYPVNHDSPLHIFLNKVVFMEYIEYFIQIYHLLQNDIIEPNKEMYNTLNSILHVTHFPNPDFRCQFLNSVYAYSYDSISRINNSTPKTEKSDVKKIEKDFNSILIVLRALQIIEIEVISDTIPLSYNVIYADQYLSYNNILHPQSNPQEKLNRTLYIVTNFIDRHQVLNCFSPKYRDLFFKEFENDDALLKKLMNLKQNIWIKYIKRAQKILEDNATTFKSNLENFVLINSFLNKIDFDEIQLELYWNGKLKSVHDINHFMNEYAFNFFSIPNYIKSLFEWISALFSYNLLNIINYVLIDLSDIRYYEQFKCFKYDFKRIVYYGSNTHELVVNSLNDLNFSVDILERRSLKHRILGLKLMLETYLKHYSNTIRENKRRYRRFGQRRLDAFAVFANIFDAVETVLKIIPTDSCKARNKIKPLIYVFSDFFDVHRTADDCR